MSDDEVDKFMETNSLVSLSEDEEETVTNTIESINDDAKKRRVIRDSFKRNDPGYNMYFILKNKVNIKIEAYSTGINVGTYIRCPFTGIRSNDKVGSIEENFYFKARMPSIGNGNLPVTLYYTTPDSFERHHFVSIPQKIKNLQKVIT